MLNRESVTWGYRILSCIVVILVSIFLIDITITKYDVVPGSVKEEIHEYGYQEDEVTDSFNYISFKYYDKDGKIHEVETKLEYEPSNTDHYDGLVPRVYYDGVKNKNYPRMCNKRRIDRIKGGTFRFFIYGRLTAAIIVICILTILWVFIIAENFCYSAIRRTYGPSVESSNSGCQSCLGRYMCPSNEAIKKVNKFAGYNDDEIEKNIEKLTEY